MAEQLWIDYVPLLKEEWRQCRDEGLCVDSYRDACAALAALPGGHPDVEAAAAALNRALLTCPRDPAFPYDEPSDWAGIVAQLPAAPVLPPVDKQTLRDRLAGAWTGRIAGCLLGKPLEGWRTPQLHRLLTASDNYPMHRYVTTADFAGDLREEFAHALNHCWADRLEGGAPSDDDTNYTVLALRLVKEKGRAFTSQDVLDAWLGWLPYYAVCTAERIAYRHAAAGLSAPATATTRNPYREYIGAQIRVDLYGYLCPGDPAAAAAMAYRDAAVSHTKNGIYGALYVAAMIAAAAVCPTPETIVQAGLCFVPRACRLRRDVEQVVAWHAAGLSADQAAQRIHEQYDENQGYDWCLAASNCMVVTMALLYGGGDVTTTLGLAVQCGFDTDCNGATCGSIVGMLRGAGAIDPAWTAPLGGKLRTALCYGDATVTIDRLVDDTLALLDPEGMPS